MRQLKVLDLRITEYISLLPSSLQFLSNLLTLHLDYCQKFDNISIIGKLLNLEILSFRESKIEDLPEEIGGLVNLKLLDLTECCKLKRIAPGVISVLVQLQELYMDGREIIWEREGYDSNTIYIEEYKKRFRKLLSLNLYDTCTILSECGSIISLLRSSAVLELMGKGSEDAVQELFRDREGVEGCQHLKELVIGDCATPECLVNTMECVPRTPNAIPSIFPILESLELCYLPNLRKICHCQLPTYSFGKLKRLAIYDCDRMEEVIWKEKGEDDSTNKMEFPALESMTLWGLPMLIGFCRGTDEIEFSQLKKLCLQKLPQLKWLFLNSSYPFSESMENHNTTFRSLFPHKVCAHVFLFYTKK
ncbi:uncharacterized protein LOC114288735 [Camellia sinensis]|uniref:uncharacterized protein LOC114288735 n=1 Tax=Camellia sinensis TaxID=4442 RepID=UPI001036336D|nr:uncharacterized protein LOC114288735 [Camellia sinensis]